MGAVAPDSSKTVVNQDTTDTTITVYHDQMVTYNDKAYPATGSLHGNDSVDFNPGQCDLCHGYPPNTGKHLHHIFNKPQKKCADCHLFTVQCSTYTDTNLNQTYYYPDKKNGLGDSVYILSPEYHLNGTAGDIVFRIKMQNLANPEFDTLIIWNNKERTCGNMKHCHPPFFPQKAIWKDEEQHK